MSIPDALDYSWGRPNVAAMKAAGIKLVCRYLSHDDSKDLSAGEAAQLRGAGIGVLPNWESEPGRPKLGAPAGSADGRSAASKAERIGVPYGVTIVYSMDADTGAADWPIIADYLRAARAATSGRYRVGVYGEADLIDYLAARGICDCYWQTYAWSRGRVSASADLLQYSNGQTLGGGSVDFNRIINAARLGAWWPAGLVPAGGGVLLTELGDGVAVDNGNGDDELNASQDAILNEILARVQGATFPNGGPFLPLDSARTVKIADQVADMAVKVDAIRQATVYAAGDPPVAERPVWPLDSTRVEWIAGALAALLARDPAVSKISAADIAAAIPATIAQQVADELAARLAKPGKAAA